MTRETELSHSKKRAVQNCIQYFAAMEVQRKAQQLAAHTAVSAQELWVRCSVGEEASDASLFNVDCL